MGLPSAHFKDTHRNWQKAIRPFIQKNLIDHAIEWDKAETLPDHVFETFAKANLLLAALPAPLPIEWLKRLGIHELYGGLKVEDFDYMHSLIFVDEMARAGIAGPSASMTTGMSFGVPPIIKFGNKQLQERFLPELLAGKKRSCIAITEPEAGSDVANVTTTAVKSKCGKYYIVNGSKKWQVYLSEPPVSYSRIDLHSQSPIAYFLALRLINFTNTTPQDHQRHLGRLRKHGRADRCPRLRRRGSIHACHSLEGLSRR